MAIKAIVHTISSAQDRNGNTYHACRVVNTATGNGWLFGDVGGVSNIKGRVGSLLGGYEYLYAIEETIPKRLFQEMVKRWPYHSHNEEGAALMQLLGIEDTVCPDGADCPDPKCIAERKRRGIL